MAGKKDIVEQALKLVTGEEAIPRIKLRGKSQRNEPDWDAIMSDIEAQTDPHPFARNERIYNDRSTFDISPFGETLHLGDIRALKPNQGSGTELIEFLKGIADKHDVPITGVAKVYHSSPGYISDTERLADWYRKRGFEVGEGYPEDGYEIRYNPRVAKGGGGIIDDVVKLAGKVISGEGDDAAQAGIRAYHGSPHDFDKFDMSKIGTGEGAQAYGHGLYFAEHEPVATGYRRSLAGPESMGTVTFDGKTLIDQGRPAEGWYDPSLGISDDLHARDLSVELLKHKGDIPSAVTAFRKKAEEDLYLANNVQNENYRQRAAKSAKAYSDFADFLEANPDRYGVKVPGSMYEVRINADPNTFLDWDKPLSEQPEAVRAALHQGWLAHPDVDANKTGAAIYGNLGRADYGNTASPDGAAAALKQAGIPGIKYLDAGSRGRGVAQVQVMYKGKPHGDPIPVHAWNQIDQLTKDYKAKGYDVEVQDLGTRNYVVFDDKLISIIRKYGIAGASAMLGYNLMENLDANQARAATAADMDFQSQKQAKANGGSVREGYQTKGRVVGDVVEQALKLIAGTGPELTAGGIRAYHGSPHYVERFDVSKIGTGEGAQAYGHGLYFAGKEDIARWYRDKLAGNSSKVVIGNETLPHWAIRDAAKAFSEIGYDPETSIMASYFVQKYGHDPVALNEAVAKNAKLPATVREAISRVNITPPSGHMYEVEIAADPNRLIDWNDPLKEQPADVRSAIMPFAEERADRMNKARREMLDRGVDMMGRPFSPKRLETLQQTADPETFTGENIYRHIQAQLGAGNVNDKAAEASQFLTEKGLHGIQYLDASSRGAGVIEPTKNFVIPEDKRISIIRRYADGGEVDDDVNDALRIAKDVGGGTPVMMEDAKGNKYDAQGNVIPQDNTGPNPQRTEAAPQQNVMFNTAPQNYSQDVQPFIDYAVTPIDRPGMPSEPDLVNVMRIATQVAAQGQPTDDRGERNFARRRSETVRSLAGASPEGYQSDYKGPFTYNAGDTADFLNTLIDFSPYGALEYAHDIPYEAGRTGDYGTAAVEGGLGALMTTPGIALAGRGIKKGYELAKQFPKLTAGAIGAGAATTGSDEAEAGPARWFSKAVEAARAIPMNKMTGEQALAMLRKGTSPEELRWMGAEDFLSGQKSVSKDDLVAFLEKNRVQLNQINLGGSNKPTRLENIDIIDIPSEIRDRHPEVYSLSNRVEELRNELVKLRSMPDQSGLDYYDNFRAVSQEFSKTQADLMRAKDAIRKEYVESIGGLGRPTKYGPDSSHGETLTTPGGKNYSENLYALPQKDIYTPFVDQMRKDVWAENYREAIEGGFTEERARAFADKFNNLKPHELAKFLNKEDELESVFQAQKSYEPQYKGGHWSDVSPDVLFHTRTSELTYEPPGANRPYRVHSIEESQSDPGQAGRKRGFKDQKAMAEVARLRQQTQDLKAKLKSEQARLYDEHQKRIAPYVDERVRYERELRDKYKKGEISLGDMNRLAEAYGSPEPELTGKYRADTYQILNPILDQIASNEAEISRIGSKIGEIPMMPFISNTDAWTDRAIKHELDKAFDNGSDYFSWTPGEVHSDRYDLSRHIGRIDYNPDDGSLIAYNPEGRMVVNESVNDPSELDEYIGEELAQKLRAEADNRRSSIDEYEIDKDDETGEWSISLYGEPSYDYNGEPLLFRSKGEARDYLNEMMANEFAEQPVTLSGLDIKTGGEGMIGYYDKIFLKRVQEVIRKATGQKPAIETIEVQTADGPRKQLGIRLTDEMREKARFSDFKKGGRVTGGTSYDSNPTVDTAIALTREY